MEERESNFSDTPATTIQGQHSQTPPTFAHDTLAVSGSDTLAMKGSGTQL